MKKLSPTTRRVLDKAIRIEQLPEIVSRVLAADFMCVNPRTLMRAERKGLLTPIKRNRKTVCYSREQLLRFAGIET
jgi:hypothetical protein